MGFRKARCRRTCKHVCFPIHWNKCTRGRFAYTEKSFVLWDSKWTKHTRRIRTQDCHNIPNESIEFLKYLTTATSATKDVSCVNKYTIRNIQVYTQTHIHTHGHTHKNIYKHTHTHSLSLFHSQVSSI